MTSNMHSGRDKFIQNFSFKPYVRKLFGRSGGELSITQGRRKLAEGLGGMQICC